MNEKMSTNYKALNMLVLSEKINVNEFFSIRIDKEEIALQAWHSNVNMFKLASDLGIVSFTATKYHDMEGKVIYEGASIRLIISKG